MFNLPFIKYNFNRKSGNNPSIIFLNLFLLLKSSTLYLFAYHPEFLTKFTPSLENAIHKKNKDRIKNNDGIIHTQNPDRLVDEKFNKLLNDDPNLFLLEKVISKASSHPAEILFFYNLFYDLGYEDLYFLMRKEVIGFNNMSIHVENLNQNIINLLDSKTNSANNPSSPRMTDNVCDRYSGYSNSVRCLTPNEIKKETDKIITKTQQSVDQFNDFVFFLLRFSLFLNCSSVRITTKKEAQNNDFLDFFFIYRKGLFLEFVNCFQTYKSYNMSSEKKMDILKNFVSSENTNKPEIDLIINLEDIYYIFKRTILYDSEKIDNKLSYKDITLFDSIFSLLLQRKEETYSETLIENKNFSRTFLGAIMYKQYIETKRTQDDNTIGSSYDRDSDLDIHQIVFFLIFAKDQQKIFYNFLFPYSIILFLFLLLFLIYFVKYLIMIANKDKRSVAIKKQNSDEDDNVYNDGEIDNVSENISEYDVIEL